MAHCWMFLITSFSSESSFYAYWSSNLSLSSRSSSTDSLMISRGRTSSRMHPNHWFLSSTNTFRSFSQRYKTSSSRTLSWLIVASSRYKVCWSLQASPLAHQRSSSICNLTSLFLENHRFPSTKFNSQKKAATIGSSKFLKAVVTKNT
jgi:hypothetical protein